MTSSNTKEIKSLHNHPIKQVYIHKFIELLPQARADRVLNVDLDLQSSMYTPLGGTYKQLLSYTNY